MIKIPNKIITIFNHNISTNAIGGLVTVLALVAWGWLTGAVHKLFSHPSPSPSKVAAAALAPASPASKVPLPLSPPNDFTKLGNLPPGSSSVQAYSNVLRTPDGVGIFSGKLKYFRPSRKQAHVSPYHPARTDINTLLQDGAIALDNGVAQTAITASSEALRLDAKSAEAHNNLAIAHAILGDYVGAYKIWAEAIRLDPSNIDYRVNLILAMSNEINTKGAIIPSTKAGTPEQMELNEQIINQSKDLIRIHPESQFGYLFLITANLFANRLSDVQDEINQLSNHNPGPGQVASLNGDLAGHQGNALQAVKFYKIAMQEKPHFPRVNLVYAIDENYLGHPKEAIVLLRKLMGYAPKYRHFLQQRELWGNLYSNPDFQELAAGKDEMGRQAVATRVRAAALMPAFYTPETFIQIDPSSPFLTPELWIFISNKSLLGLVSVTSSFLGVPGESNLVSGNGDLHMGPRNGLQLYVLVSLPKSLYDFPNPNQEWDVVVKCKVGNSDKFQLTTAHFIPSRNANGSFKWKIKASHDSLHSVLAFNKMRNRLRRMGPTVTVGALVGIPERK